MASIQPVVEHLARSIEGLANTIAGLREQNGTHLWRDVVAPGASLLTALVALASVWMARQSLRLAGKQRLAQIQPMVIYQSDFEEPDFEKTAKPDQVGKVALINGGNGIALNVRALSRHVDAEGKPVDWHRASAIHVGGSHFLKSGDPWYEASRSCKGASALVGIVINYTDAAGNPYHSVRRGDGNWTMDEGYLEEAPSVDCLV